MNPTPSDANSPLATLRQLKDMLDAGAITQSEFDALKQRLIFGADPASAATPAPGPAGPAPTYPATPPVPAAPAEAAPPTPYLDTPAALTPEATPLLMPEPDWLAAPTPSLLPSDEDEPAEAVAPERRNPLNLVFALGGLLLFLAVVAYLALGHRPDEHVTSQSQTAADSTLVKPDEGPQAEQLVLPPATGPDTIRVAPATPPPAATTATLDSAAALPANSSTPSLSPATAPAQGAKPAASPPKAAPKPTVTPASADTLRSPQPDGR